MPDIRNCKRCGKVYGYMGGMPICNECKVEDEENFKKVKEYLYNNPGSSLSQVSNALEISSQRIKAYLKDGRLEIVGEGANIVLECEKCGKSIRSGRLCDECTKELSKGFEKTSKDMARPVEDHETKVGEGLRYLNKDKNK